MDEHGANHSRAASKTVLRSLRLVLPLALLSTGTGFSQSAPDDSGQMTLAQFRSLVAARMAAASRSGEKSRSAPPAPDLRIADELFLQLLLMQARDAAAHQSLDRISGWSKAIQTRFQTQSAPQLDVELIRFEEARMAAESARIEAEQQRLISRANRLLGRPASAPLVALLPHAGETGSGEVEGAQKQAKEVLAQGEELLARMYQSYQFGGTSLTSLMEYEKTVYEFDLRYREAQARDALKEELD